MEILEALETKTEELKVVKEVHDSLKHKSVEEKPDFKYNSNKKQFKFNAEVKNKCNQISGRAGADDTITDNRNKLISIADQDGWEYIYIYIIFYYIYIIEYSQAEALKMTWKERNFVFTKRSREILGDTKLEQ